MRISKQNLLILVLAVIAMALLMPAALADKVLVTNPFILDTTTDRIPAKTAFPEYPRIARRDRIEGDATVCFRIDSNGRIRSARLRTATHPIFKRAALRAIRASSFEPLAPNQLLATSLTCRTFRFRLKALQTTASAK